MIMTMSMKARKHILFGVVVLLITGRIWGLQSTIQASEEEYKHTEPQNLGLTEADVADRIGVLYVEVWGEHPEKYVDLTEEEITKFPELQTAVQSLEETNQTEYKYRTTEAKVLSIHSYIERRTQEKYNCPKCAGNFFKYQGEFYIVYVAITEVNKTTSTSEAPQTTTVADGLSALGVLVLLGTGFGILFAQRSKYGKCKS